MSRSTPQRAAPMELGDWLALLLVGGFGSLIALPLIAIGVIVLLAESQAEPLEMEFATFQQLRPDEEWLRLTNCMLSVPEARIMEGEFQTATELFIPVLDPDSDYEQVSLLLRTKDPAHLAFMRAWDAFDGTEEETRAWLDERESDAYPIVEIQGMLDDRASELDALEASIPEATWNLAILDEGEEPGAMKTPVGAGLIVVGLVAGLLTVGALVWIRRWQRRPRLDRPEDIVRVFAEDDDEEPIEFGSAPATYGYDQFEDEPDWQGRPPLIYRRGDVVVVEHGAGEFLPNRCVKCNAVTRGVGMRRTLHWHHPAVYLLLLAGLLPFLIVGLIVRKNAVVWVSLCPRHRRRRADAIALGWGGFLLASVLVFVGALQGWTWLVMLAGIATVVCPLVGFFGARIVWPLRITDREAHLRGMCDSYVAGIPTASSVGRGRR